MIHSVTSTDERFHPVHFGPGLNIVLAERAHGSSEKDSRNGLGKTSLLEIIHFCLGARFDKNHILAHPELRAHTYSLDIDLGAGRFIISRCPDESNVIHLSGPVTQISLLGFEPRLDKKKGLPALPVARWNEALGRMLFGLGEEESNQSFAPTFRSMIGYFIRRGAHAFSQPFEHHPKQNEWDLQVNTAHLLQLDWRYPYRWQVLREKKKLIDAIKKSASEGVALSGISSTDRLGDLEAARVNLEEKMRREGMDLKAFKVHPQYHELETEASHYTMQVHELNNLNVSDREMLAHYEAALGEETSAPEHDVEKLYLEAGIVLPDHVMRRIDDVQEFHSRLIRNRRDFLGDARTRLAAQIELRDAEIRSITAKRAGIMMVLQTHGALEEYTLLQQRHLRTEAQLKDLDRRIDALRRFDESNLTLKAERANLEVEAHRDFQERHAVLERARTLFNRHSHALYDSPGRLIIEPKAGSGYTFDYQIDRKGAQGVNHMVVFCYDLMLARLWAEPSPYRGPACTFLIHDSAQFDGADERQFTQALHLAHTASQAEGFQYICCLNSDRIPTSGFPDSFDWRSFVKLTLNDGAPEGSLFGFRFGRDEMPSLDT